MNGLGLRERVGLILLFQALVMFTTVVVFTFVAARWRSEPVYQLPDPDQVAAVAAAFEQTPPAAHGDLARALTNTSQTVVILPSLPTAGQSIGTEQTADRYREALHGRPFRVLASSPAAPDDFGQRPFFSTGQLQVAAALADGRSVAVSEMAPPTVTQIVNRTLLFVLLVVGINLIFAVLIAAQTRRPVERLLRAVRADRAEDFIVSGPREIVALGAAFQELRTRLHAMVEERTRMLAAIAHDYRTYLTRLELRSDFIDDERQRDLASRDIAEMNLLIDDTLLFAQGLELRQDDPPSCDVAAALRRTAQEREAIGQRVVLKGAADAVEACIDSLSLSRILTNLLDNVVRYGAGAATVTLASSPEVILLCIDDDGPGVPEEALPLLTEPFHRLEASRSRDTGGVGLGLSIVQALASRHGGRLTLANRPEGGLRAQLQLRRAPCPDSVTSRNNPPEHP